MKDLNVSIIVPVLNGEKYIEDAIKSAQNQSYKDYEMIVIDGSSTDRTLSIVNRLAKQDKRITVVNQPKPGLAAAQNYGVSLAKGEFIAFLEADDLWHPDKLMLQLECLRSNPKIGLASCYSVVINENGYLMGWQLGVNVNGMVYEKVIERNPISTCSIPMIRCKYLQEIGLFDEQVRYVDDAEMWIRFAKKFPIATIPKALVGYRRWTSNRSKDYKGMILDGESVLNRVFENDPNLNKRFYNFCISRNASTITGMCIIDGEYKEAKEHLMYSLSKSKTALFSDFRMLGIAFLVILSNILPVIIFKNMISKLMLPMFFKTRTGKKFIDL